MDWHKRVQNIKKITLKFEFFQVEHASTSTSPSTEFG